MFPRISRSGPIAAVLLAALLALSGCTGALPTAGSDGAQQSASRDLSAAAGTGGDAGGGGGVGSYYTEDGDRVVVREADVSMRVQDFAGAFREMRAIADRYGGYVGDRSQNSRGEWAEGSLTIRVPPENFSAARDALAALGHVEREDVRVKDFTSQYESRQRRIEDLRTEERALERRLNRTDEAGEARRIRRDLRDVREKRRGLQRDQQSLRDRESLSTIRVDAHEPVGERPPENYRSAFGFTDAFLEAFYGGLNVVKHVIVFFGYAIPVGLALLPLGAFGVGLLAGFRRLRAVTERVLGAGSGPGVRTGPADEGGEK